MSKHGFESSLAADLRAFIRFKRSLGVRYVRAEFTLRQFDRLVARLEHEKGVTSLRDAVSSWLAERTAPKPVSVATELGVVRQFCLYLHRHDGRSFVPGRDWAPQSAKSAFVPHVFSTEQIARILDLVEKLQPRFRRHTFRALLVLLYCTGLRFGEAVRLRIRDVDFRKRVIFVAESKGRARSVPFDTSLDRELRSYLRMRRRVSEAKPDNAFFAQCDGRPLSVRIASDTVRRLLRRAGLKPAKGRSGPRPYDFRHTFAVHRLTRWYRSGVDLHAHLSLLSAYMGHENLLGTEVYLQATPELLELAGSRFRRRLLQAEGSDGPAR